VLQRPKFLPSIDKAHCSIDERLGITSALFHSRLARIALAPNAGWRHFSRCCVAVWTNWLAPAISRQEVRRSDLMGRQVTNIAPVRAADAGYVVTRQLPERNGEFEYRIKKIYAPRERVALESELARE
jgi:hypothetical protein